MNCLWPGGPKNTRPELERSRISVFSTPYPLSSNPRVAGKVISASPGIRLTIFPVTASPTTVVNKDKDIRKMVHCWPFLLPPFSGQEAGFGHRSPHGMDDKKLWQIQVFGNWNYSRQRQEPLCATEDCRDFLGSLLLEESVRDVPMTSRSGPLG